MLPFYLGKYGKIRYSSARALITCRRSCASRSPFCTAKPPADKLHGHAHFCQSAPQALPEILREQSPTWQLSRQG